jgi:hypothetical protein
VQKLRRRFGLERVVLVGGQPVLQIVVGYDAATLTVNVTDEKGKPVPGAYVFLVPANVVSEAQLAGRAVQGESSQAGLFVARSLPPGAWLILARTKAANASVESAAELWRALPNAKRLNLAPNAATHSTLTLAQ